MGLRARGLLHGAGALAILAAGISLFAVGVAPVQAAPHHLNAAPSPPSCAHQPNLNDPTNSNNKVLESYWFAIEHAGQTTTVCTVFGNVASGDIVTAHFTLAPSTATATATGAEITLVTNTASTTTTQQSLFDCASFSVRGRFRHQRRSVPRFQHAGADGARTGLRLPGGSHLRSAARHDGHRAIPDGAPVDRWPGW